jgi:hypothetical protein
VAASEGKKIEEGTIMSKFELVSNSVAVADPPEARSLNTATSKQVADIPTSCRIEY